MIYVKNTIHDRTTVNLTVEEDGSIVIHQKISNSMIANIGRLDINRQTVSADNIT